MKEESQRKCNCKKKKCDRYGKCEECIAHHKQNPSSGLPYCQRPKKTKKV